MRDPFGWSVSLGKWGPVEVRLHGFFVLFAAATYFLCWREARSGEDSLFASVTSALSLLFLSVLAHEWGHYFAGRSSGVRLRELIIGPLGGVTPWPAGTTAAGELVAAVAGPLLNLALCAAAILASYAFTPVNLSALLDPLQLFWTRADTPFLVRLLQLSIWINGLVFLANVLPAYPFDGGRILRCVLSLLRPGWHPRRVAENVYWIAVGLAGVLLAVALVTWKPEADVVFPTSLAFFVLAVVILVSARRDLDAVGDPPLRSAAGTRPTTQRPVAAVPMEAAPWDDQQTGEPADIEPGGGAHTSSAHREPVAAVETDEPMRAAADQDEERLVDAILSRLHEHGWSSLTDDERALLERASVRYRNRLGRRG